MKKTFVKVHEEISQNTLVERHDMESLHSPAHIPWLALTSAHDYV